MQQQWFQEDVLVEVLDQSPQGIKLARIFAIQSVIGRKEMTVLRIDLIISLAVRFGQFFQGHPRFVVLLR